MTPKGSAEVPASNPFEVETLAETPWGENVKPPRLDLHRPMHYLNAINIAAK